MVVMILQELIPEGILILKTLMELGLIAVQQVLILVALVMVQQVLILVALLEGQLLEEILVVQQVEVRLLVEETVEEVLVEILEVRLPLEE